MGEETCRKNCALPPWLWLWLIFYIYIFSLQINYWRSYLRDIFYFYDPLTLANIPELLPSFAILLGVISIFFPRTRATWLERKFKLIEIDSASLELSERTKQIALEIEDFLKLHAPSLQIKVNFHLFDQNSFLYASGYRKTSIALFGGMLRLWRLDRKAAECILLHEIGHYRNGDALIIGAGSFFEWVLRHCLIITAFLFLVPAILVTIYPQIDYLCWSVNQELNYIDAMRIRMSMKDVIFYFLNPSSTIVFEVKNLLLIIISGLLAPALWLLLWTINTFIPPIIGIWCAEINADRFMTKATNSPDASIRALDRISEDMPVFHWLISQVSHPPKLFRKWMVNSTEKTESIVIFLLLFPFAYFITLVEPLTRTFLVHTGGMSKLVDLGGLANIGIYLRVVSIAWLFSSFFIILWPIIAVYWVRFFSGEIEFPNWENYKQYVFSAFVVLCLFAVGYFI